MTDDVMFLPFADVFPEDRVLVHLIGGVYAKELHIPAGFILGSHAHHYDHMSILSEGRVQLEMDGEVQHRQAPHVFNIKAGTMHTLRAVTDAVWFCVHATDVVDAADVDETLIIKDTI